MCLELFIYFFALFKCVAGLSLALRKRSEKNGTPWYRCNVRAIEGIVILILLTSFLAVFALLLESIMEGSYGLLAGELAMQLEVGNTILLSVLMIWVVWGRWGYRCTNRRGKER